MLAVRSKTERIAPSHARPLTPALSPEYRGEGEPMHRILVLANNLKQASYRVRVEALVPLMRERGFEFDVQLRPGSWLPRRRLLGSADRYHAVLLQRKLLDPWDARLLRRAARKIYYDIDDAVMYHNRPVSWVSRWRTSRRFRATARVLDHVVAGNEYLARIFR